MKILVLTAAAPFAPCPARRMAAELASSLQLCGHDVLVVNLPVPPGPAPVEHVAALRALRLPNVDRAIALGFPACAVRHPGKVVWLAVDDTWCPYGRHLRESRAVYAASKSAAVRLKEESGVEAGLLIPPANGSGWRQVAEVLTA